MLDHLDDPNPPPPSPDRRAGVARRAARLRRRRRTLAAATVILIVAAAGAAATVVAEGRSPATHVTVGATPNLPTTTPPTASRQRSPAPAARHDPPVIAVVQQRHLELLDAATGKVLRRLGGAVPAISLSPNGRDIYAQRGLGHFGAGPIDRIPTNGRPAVQIAAGTLPTISPDGTRLAYETGTTDTLTIQTLATGRRRRIGLRSLVGPTATMSSPLTWLSNHQLVTVPAAEAVPTTAAGPAVKPSIAPAGTCSALYTHHRQCAIVIDLDAAHPAHLVTLDLPRNFSIDAAGPGPVAGQLLIGSGISQPSIVRFTVTDTTATRTSSATTPAETLVIGFSPTGHNVLYLQGHGPVQLWTGHLTPTTVTPTTKLIPNADLGTASW